MGVKIGCCGFPINRRKYYAAYGLVEIQQTFYRPPQVQTCVRWRADAPAEFEFAVKAWQLITHDASSPTYRRLGRPVPSELRDRYGSFRPTDEVRAAWATTAGTARALGARLVVFQCPPRFTPTDEHVGWLRRFFAEVDRGDLVLAWEPRGDWPRDLVAGLCGELDLVHVVDPLRGEALSKGLRYFRLHGLTGYRYLHTEEDLRALARCLTSDGPNYVLFNNLFMGEDAKRFQALVQKGQGPRRPAPRPGA